MFQIYFELASFKKKIEKIDFLKFTVYHIFEENEIVFVYDWPWQLTPIRVSYGITVV